MGTSICMREQRCPLQGACHCLSARDVKEIEYFQDNIIQCLKNYLYFLHGWTADGV